MQIDADLLLYLLSHFECDSHTSTHAPSTESTAPTDQYREVVIVHTCAFQSTLLGCQVTQMLHKLFFFFLNYFIVVQLQLSSFLPPTPSHPSQTHLPPLLQPPLGFVHVSFIVVPENPSPCYPLTSPPEPSHPHLPPLILPQLVFVRVSFIVVPENPSPFPHPIIPSNLPSGYCLFVLNFNVSDYTLLACSFC